jgi:hypothetical protein
MWTIYCSDYYLVIAHITILLLRWFSPVTPASSTTKTGRHDIAEILLKVALKHQKSKSSGTLKGKSLWEQEGQRP